MELQAKYMIMFTIYADISYKDHEGKTTKVGLSDQSNFCVEFTHSSSVYQPKGSKNSICFKRDTVWLFIIMLNIHFCTIL